MPRLLAILLAGLVAPAVTAAPRIAILPFTGPGANAARNQVVSALCSSAVCVPQAKVGAAPKPDWKKIKKEKVDYVVTGTVAKDKKKKLTVELVVFKGPGKPKLKRLFPLDGKGKLSDATLDTAGAVVLKSMGISGDAPEPVAKRPDPEPVRPPVVARADPEPPESEPAPVVEASSSSTESSSEVVATPDEPYRPKKKDPLFVLEAGPDVFTRRFSYTGVETRNLRSYSANLVVAPRLRAEVYPLAALTRGLPAGFGLEFGYAFAVGLQSRRTDGPAHPTALNRLDVGAKLKIKPTSGEAAIIPSVGFRRASFMVSAASDGSTLDGLPAITYSALVAGLGGELPMMDNKLIPFIRVAYLPVLSSGEIISAAYFPRGSASGLEASLGAGYRLAPSIEVHLTGQLTRYALAFQTQEGDPYVATGAADLYLGANLSARYIY